jgi:ZIP family zinc transporter
MLFVISHEIVPETHRNGYEVEATFGLVGGFVLMLVMHAALG